MASLVVVFPALPVTPTTVPPHFARAHAASSCKASSVSLTINSLGAPVLRSTTTPAAPLAAAEPTKSWPSWLGPRRAK